MESQERLPTRPSVARPGFPNPWLQGRPHAYCYCYSNSNSDSDSDNNCDGIWNPNSQSECNLQLRTSKYANAAASPYSSTAPVGL